MTPATNPSGMRASTLAEILPRSNADGRTRQRNASAVKPAIEQLAALPDHAVPADACKRDVGRSEPAQCSGRGESRCRERDVCAEADGPP